MTIGQVVARLRQVSPDISISKIRFLEEEGLVSPERTAGGYRKFSSMDLARVELILRMQKELFLPLSVIREKLIDYDRGKVPAEIRQLMGSVEPLALPLDEAEMASIEDIPSTLGIPISFVKELASFGLIELLDGGQSPGLTRADIQIVRTCWDMRRFGVEPRHLRMYETFAERETAFFSQILMPAFRHRTPETRQKLVEALSDLTTLSEQLTSSLVRRSLGRVFEDVV